MRDPLFWINQLGVIVFVFSGLVAVFARLKKRDTLHQVGLAVMAVIGPCTLFLCYQVQETFRAEDAVFWSRLMAGDVSRIWAIGSLGIIVGSGLAVGALALTRNAIALFAGAVFFACSWYVLYLHPTPHYVPLPPWLDKLIWFATIVGGAAACIVVFYKLKDILKRFLTPLTLLAGLFGLLSAPMLYSQWAAQTSVDLSKLEPKERIVMLGCLSCHVMDGVGHEEPGGAIEAVAARNESTVRAFLAQPDKETAERLGIRRPASGEMAGVKLTPEQVELLTDALMSLFDVKPPSDLGPGAESVEAIISENRCLDCHAVRGEGQPGGGIGGDLSAAAARSEDVLVQWLIEPTRENAEKLGIRDEPMGAMVDFALEEDDARAVARWLKTLGD
ncbi:MAG: c-type cytochrome [Planctomycetota bacterium]